MAYSHVAHDCVLGNHVILANSVGLAGHVDIGDYAILGGLSAVHQFCRVGRYAFLAGGAMAAHHVDKDLENIRFGDDAHDLILSHHRKSPDLVLERVNKGENFESSLSALRKIKSAGAKSSVMILNGMGGKRYSRQHAVHSAKLMNEAQPEFLSTLVVSFPAGTERYQAGFNGEFEALDQRGLFEEMYLLLDELELENTVFRSDHASNYLVLRGTLGRDKQRLLQTVRHALDQPGAANLRPEWMRGL